MLQVKENVALRHSDLYISTYCLFSTLTLRFDVTKLNLFTSVSSLIKFKKILNHNIIFTVLGLKTFYFRSQSVIKLIKY